MNDVRVRQHTVDQLAEEFAERYRRGERPKIADYVERYPEHAEEIRDLFPALVMMEDVAPVDDESFASFNASGFDQSHPSQIGDFRIIREVGRGGMGIVYEAEQISLGRHVALKVLPRQLLFDDRHLRRFEREARAAARLHHTNVVPVFGVGEEDGLHYFVMQFIPGLGLDEVIGELKRLKTNEASEDAARDGGGEDLSAANVARSLLSGAFGRTTIDAPPYAEKETAAASKSPAGGETTKMHLSDTWAGSSSGIHLPGQSKSGTSASNAAVRTYWQSVARLGRQVADAMQYAHEQGILHRDIKPANLLMDMRGTVWITDFGLAKATDQQDITHTGDVLGTLRYMPPEAFSGKVDARSDIYSLGLTLYELVTLQPAFQETDRNRLIKLITSFQPEPIGKLNPDVPKDLATIIHKAMERDPAHRYQTAGELAGDLDRFGNDEPIRARRVSTVERLARWSRRNRGLAASLGAVTALLLIIAVGGAAAAVYFNRQSEEQARLAEANGNLVVQKEQALEGEERQRKQAQATLFDSLAREAHALRLGRKAGYREEVWKRLQQALAIDTPNRDLDRLRQEAVACLGDFLGRKPKSIGGFTNAPGRMAVHPDGDRVFVGLQGGGISIRRIADGVETARLAGHVGNVWQLRFAPDGKQLLTADVSGNIFQWKPDDRGGWSVASKFKEKQRPIIEWMPDGKRFLVTHRNTTEIRIRPLDEGGKVTRLNVDASRIRSTVLAVSPNGKQVASITFDNRILIWDAATRKIVHNLSPPMKAFYGVGFSPDGKYLIAGSDWGFITYETERFTQWSIVKLDSVMSLAFSPDGQYLAFGTLSRKVKLWSLTTQSEVAVLDHADRTNSHCTLAFSRDGKRLCSAGAETVRIWDIGGLAEKLLLTGHNGGISGIAFSPDGKLLASAGKDKTVTLWDARTGEARRRLTGLEGLAQTVAFSPDGGLLATAEMGVKEGGLKIWDVESGRKIAQPFQRLGGVFSIRFSADGTTLAASGLNGLRIWHLKIVRQPGEQPTFTLERVAARKAHRCLSLAISPDGQSVAWLINNREIRLWDIEKHRAVDLGGPPLLMHGWHNLSFHPNGRHLYAVDKAGSVLVWDIVEKKRAFRLESTRRFLSFHHALSPNGRLLAVNADPAAATIFDTTSRRRIYRLGDERAPIWSLAFSPDNQKLALGLSDGGLVIWDLQSVRKQLADIGFD